MNVDVLSRMLKEIVLFQDEVTLPGFGSFVAEEVPASFTDKGYTINPPYRRLAYRPHQGKDTFLVDAYSRYKNISRISAGNELETFFSEMRVVLKAKKLIVLPGLGRFRATKENHFFFVCDEDLDIFPEGFGLEPISLKSRSTHKSNKGTLTPHHRRAVEDVDSGQTKEVEVESKAVEIKPSPAETVRRKTPAAVKALIVLAIVLVVASALLFALKQFAPDILYKLLYSKEELEILKYILK